MPHFVTTFVLLGSSEERMRHNASSGGKASGLTSQEAEVLYDQEFVKVPLDWHWSATLFGSSQGEKFPLMV